MGPDRRAEAGIQEKGYISVIPAKAGIQEKEYRKWIRTAFYIMANKRNGTLLGRTYTDPT